MSKVLVDRELLERVVALLEWDGMDDTTPLEFGAKCDSLCKELSDYIARPAEAEGVARYDLDTTRCDSFGQDCGAEMEPYALGEWIKYDDHLAAVTAETDRLAAENKLLRGPEQTVVICEKGKPYTFMAKDPCRYSLCEVTYAAPVRALAAERDQLRAEAEALRKDAERYRWASSGVHEAETLVSIVNCHGGYAEKVAERVDVYREAAMAAKEA